MAKRLFDMLKHCQEEEEVKAEFAKYFRIKYNTRNRIDLYTPQILFEFKHCQNFKSRTVRAKAVAQTLYYIRRLKYGKNNDPVPPTICIVDKDEGFFVTTSDFSSFINASKKYDWDRAASQPCPILVEALKQSKLIENIHVYSFENVEDEAQFKDAVAVQTQASFLDSNKKAITEDNFTSVYTYWESLFGRYVQNGHKPSEYFVSDIESGRSQIIGDSEVLFRLSDGSASKSIPMKEYQYFWSIYEKIDNPSEIKAIRQKIDRLSEDFMRRFTGEFYTPISFASKAFEYIERTVGTKKYLSGNWRIWDMAAGTGNLEFMLPSSALKYCYISTLLDDDAAYCKKIYPSATVFQYDYLNDDAFRIANPSSTPFGVTPKMPPNLVADLANPEISWIIFINPPFATSNKTGNEIGKKSKDDISMTNIQKLMEQAGLGETSRELFSQFLYRISIEFNGKNAFLGLFSKIKYLNSNNDQRLRDQVFRYKFERGFIFSSEHFPGSKGKFPVGFLVWNLRMQIALDSQKIILDVYNEDCEKVGTKQVLTSERDSFLSKWVVRYRNTQTFPPFSSALNIGQRSTDVRDRIADNFICSLMSKGNDMQNQNYVAIFSGPYASAGGYSVVPGNFEQSMVVHAVRRIPKASWTNDRDQFYQPFSEPLPNDFISDCVVWSAFAPSNNTVALKDIEYKGTVYQIENQMFPFLLSEVTTWSCPLSDLRSQLFSANEDRFLAKWLENASLSQEASDVLNAARTLYKCVFEKLNTVRWLDYRIQRWDIGWWQVKEAAKKIDAAQLHLETLSKRQKLLAAKINSQLSDLGFMAPGVEPLE